MAYVALARGRDDWSRARMAWFGGGLLVLWLALETPLDRVADEHLQSAHMLQHVLLGVIAPPMLVLGASPSMAAAVRARAGIAARLAEPVEAQVVAALVMIAWHLPALYDLTLASEAVHVLEHLTFIAAGVLFWLPVMPATAAGAAWRLSEVGALGYLLAGTIPQDGVALVLQFSRVEFYGFYAQPGHALPGWDPVIDQNVAGTVLQLVGKTSYFAAALVIFFRWVARDQAEPDPAG